MTRLLKITRNEVHSVAALIERLGDASIADHVVEGIDVRDVPGLAEADVAGALFLGCVFRDLAQQADLVRRGAAVFPHLDGLPYDPYRTSLYDVDELMQGYEAGGYTSILDFKIYTHFDRERRNRAGISVKESLAQRVHDHAIDAALEDVLSQRSGRGVVGVMGGHGTLRSDPYFLKVARLTWRLTRAGYLVASGGGPGIMEAANLGAFFANYENEGVLEAVVAELSAADKFDGGEAEGTPAYLDAIRAYFACGRAVLETFGPGASQEVVERYGRERPEPGASLAIPTWFYGHEPSNLFSTHVAKYFSNSLREDGLLAISTAGVVYAPGSAGTYQEVFMDLAQNHYATFKVRSPMVFLGSEPYAALFQLIQQFVAGKGAEKVYGDLLAMCDEPEEIAAFIEANPPRPREEKRPLYELS
jgi:predicted Rossmann-fold nucleotide-binding protein